jgi:hypothetical protein
MEMEALAERLENLILHTLNKDDIPVLRSMRDRLLYKKDLTEKQIKFLDIIEARSRTEIKYVDIDLEINELVLALRAKILVGTSTVYWSARPGTYSRCLKIFKKFESENRITEDDLSYIKNVFKKWMLDWETSKESTGQLRFFEKKPALIIGNRCVNVYGNIAVEVMIDGQKQLVQFNKLKKR